MATRMQQRRGTQAQWTAANPILAAGEIGFETDTSRFKMGNGSSTWSALQYFANSAELASLLDGAPDLLNTLNELAASIGDDPAFFTTTANNLALKAPLASPTLTGTPTAPTADSTTNTTQIATTEFVQTKVNQLIDAAPGALNTLNEIAAALGDDENFAATVSSNIATKVSKSGDTMTGALSLPGAPTELLHAANKGYVDGAIDALDTTAEGYVNTHNSATTSVHGIADTSNLATLDDLAESVGGVTAGYSTLGGVGIVWNADTEKFDIDSTVATESDINDHNLETTNVHGIADTSALATNTDVSDAITAQATITTEEISDHNSETTNVHGIADTSALETTTGAQDKAEAAASGAVSTHSAVTTSVHGIADTSALATKTYADDAVSTHNNDTTNVHGIADTSLLATTSYVDSAEADAITAAGTAADGKISTAVAALTKSSVGLGNVDNTSDADKPVSDDTQDALDLKANLANPTFTGTVTSTGALVVEGNLTVSGTTTTVNAADLSIQDPLIYLASNQYTEDLLDVGFLAATGAPGGTEASHLHSGFFRDASDSKKWKLVSNVPHPVGNVVDVTNATRETLVVGPLEATTVTASSGVIFSDGTQTKEGVPSRTPIVPKTASYALSTLTHRDSMIEVSSTDPTTITIPLDSTVNYPVGTTIDILQTNTGQVTIAPVSGSVTVNATPGLKLRTRWSSATLMKRAANTWVVYGDLTA
jgi:citrate lyase gamma subunit